MKQLTNKQLKLIEVATANKFAVYTSSSKVVLVDLYTATLCLAADGRKHHAWVSPRRHGSVHDVTLTEAFAMVGA